MQLNKLNRELYTLIFSQSIQPMTQKMSKNQIRLNYKQYNQCMQDTDYTALKNVTFGEQWPTIAYIFTSPISKYINVSEINFGYIGTS